jgi:hypothetical protein
MTVLRPQPILSSKKFTWSKKDKSYVAEASDLGLRAGFQFGRVYDDACDEGFTMESQYDGKDQVVCVLDSVEVDNDNDTQWWVLKPVDTKLDWRVIIFND